jgi:hypothetical protein
MFDIQSPFEAVASAIRHDGNSPDHQAASLAAELFGIGFKSSFGLMNECAGFTDHSRDNSNSNSSAVEDPFTSIVGAFMEKEMQAYIDAEIQRTIYPFP